MSQFGAHLVARVARTLAFLAGFALALVGLGGPTESAAAPLADSVAVAYLYDVPLAEQLSDAVLPERGPPTSGVAAGQWSEPVAWFDAAASSRG